jgi:hypothetical protein
MRTAALALGMALAVAHTAWGETLSPIGSQVRSANPAIVASMVKAVEQSPTFRGLVETINASDGIVYVEEGPCGHGVRACLMAVMPAGPYRVLRIRVGRRPSEASLMAVIGHELRHAIEVLSDPRVTSTEAMQQFYLRQGSKGPGGAIETIAAVTAGDAVSAELRKYNDQRAAK